MVLDGQAAGGNQGNDFRLMRNEPVTKLDLWWGSGSSDAQNYTVLKGIKVHWHSGSEATGTTPEHEQERILHTSYTFSNGGREPLEWMDIYGHGRVDSIRFVTKDKDFFTVGGIGGQKTIQPAKNKLLYGFYGKSHSDIVQLGAIFDH
ncbi:hypothetical protein BJX63DRAFT_416061 [Aspergillus granulosus]|uniref:Jacalin-type lectin domain-containing protein n=1 Tax=Aspergillus granulosus TaxID=176169 RepID=A0ABR4GTY1_9EURO